jgi:hypothetical protein
MKYEEDDILVTSPEATSLKSQMMNLSEALTEAIGRLRESARDFAKKDNAMRIAKAKAFLKTEGKNKEEREAKADAGWQAEREAAGLAEADKNTDTEEVRSLRAQLSALQSLMYANRSENDSIRYGQTQH